VFCSKDRSAETSAGVRNLLIKGIDWTRFLQLVEYHGVLHLVHPTLVLFEDLIPAEVLICVRERSTAQVRRALWLAQLLEKLMKAMQQAGISSLPYKGPVLAERLYGDIAMREYCDLDVFVRSSDVAGAHDALHSIGFVPQSSLRPKEQEALLGSGYEIGFDGIVNKNIIELQWRVLPRFYSIDLDVEDLFAGAQTCAIAGVQVQTLADEDLALALCAHAAKHAWNRLGWTCDIAQLVRVGDVDWNRVARRATALGINRIVGVSIFLAHRLLGAPLPAELHTIMDDDPEVQNLAAEIIGGMSENIEIDPESFAYFRLMLRIRERVSDRMRFLMRLVVTPTEREWSLVKLPDWLFPLYRAVRVIRLGARLLRINAA
jgi:hypothetical protein